MRNNLIPANMYLISLLSICSVSWNAAFAIKPGCSPMTSIDLSGGEILENGTIVKGYAYDLKNQINGANGTKLGCVCRIKPCLRKCCPFGEFMFNRTCFPGREKFNGTWINLDKFHVLFGNECVPPKRRRLVDPDTLPNVFIVRSDGVLFFPDTGEKYHAEDYCVDYIDDEERIKALTCMADSKIVDATSVIGMIISMPFLLATFLVYALLPDRNLHGTSLMCYVMTLFGACFLLVVIQLYPYDVEDNICITVAIFCLFFFMVSFFMMNVMSIDIWWTFSGLRGFSGSRKEKERKRFLLYSAYAWGVPLILVAIVVPLTLNDEIPADAWYNPGIARGQCWFYEGYPKLVFFYGPIAVLIFANIVLFIVTAYKIKQVQKATAILKKSDSKRHAYENDKQRFNLYLKLMLAMGVNWSMEIISWAINWQVVQVPNETWYFTDFLNASYGVFIFFIFVFKKSVWRLLKKRYYLVMGKPHMAKTITLVDTPRNTPIPNNRHGDAKKHVEEDTTSERL